MTRTYLHSRLRITLYAVSIVLCSCSPGKHVSERAKQEALLSRMIYSPNGEPLNGGPLGRPSCNSAMSRWFDRVDTTHDHAISRDEFMADARSQFIRMDIDKNGYLVPEELERYRVPYRQEAIHGQPAQGQAANTQEKRNKHQEGRDAADNQPGDSVDPVMSADTNLDSKVTPEEFMIHAGTVFSELDTNHDGSLSLEEVLAPCTPVKDDRLSNFL